MKIEESILQQLDDHIVLTQSMSFSPFKKPFEDAIDKWEKTLVLVSNIIEEWLKVQRQWMYLEPIFSSEDIKTQLPVESKRFDQVDLIYRRAMRCNRHTVSPPRRRSCATWSSCCNVRRFAWCSAKRRSRRRC